MSKKLVRFVFILSFIISSFLGIFLNYTMQAESESLNKEKVELIKTGDILATVDYHETDKTTFWRLVITKYSSMENRILSVGLSSQGEGIGTPQLSDLPDTIIAGEGNQFKEAVLSKEEASYTFEFSTTKLPNDAAGQVLINLNLTQIDDNGVNKIILDANTDGNFQIIPKTIDQTSEIPKESTGNSQIAEDKNISNFEEKVIQKQEVTSDITPSVLKANDNDIYPTFYGQSLFSLIQPAFANPSVLDPFNYVTDLLGKYPTHNSVTGQGAEVRNYNYGVADSTPLITGRSRPAIAKPSTMSGQALNFTTGYHDYSGAYLKKWVEPAKDQNGVITDPSLFNVYLEAIGDGTVDNSKHIDIVIVIDKSSTMSGMLGSTTKDVQTQAAVRNFADKMFGAGLSAKIGLTSFGSTSNAGDGGTPYSDTELLTASYSTINNSSVLSRAPLGYRPTALGIQNGLAALYGNGSRNSADKYLIVLSDGAPTKYYRPVQVRSKPVGSPPSAFSNWGDFLATNNGTTPGVSSGPLFNYDGSFIANNEKYPNKFGPVTSGNPSFPATDGVSDFEYQWTGYQWAGTGDTTSAKDGMVYTIGYENWLLNQDPQYANLSLYNIGVGLGGSDNLSTMGRNTLKNLAKDPTHYSGADAQNQVGGMLARIASSITKTVKNAHIIDPLGDGVTLVGNPIVNSFSVAPSGKTAWSDTSINDPKQFVVLTKSAGDRGLEWSNIYLGKNEGLSFSYQVQISEPYQSGLFQQTNGETYVENGTTMSGPPYDSANRLHFAIPSARYKATTSITVQKVWSDSTNMWGLRTPVTLQLQRMVPGGSYQNVSGATYTIQPSATGTQLQNTFTGLDKFDSTGQRYTYQVIENAGPTGYATPTYSNQNLTVTNALITTNLTFKKLDNDGLTALPNIVFELRAANGRKIQATSNSSGVVTFTGIPIGTHSIAEVTDLNGYQALPSFKATVSKVSDTLLSTTYNMAGVPAEMYTLSGQNLTVINKYEKGKFSFKKVGNDGVTPLSQVTFDLIQGGSVVQEVTSTTNGTVLFNNIYPGNYTLKEVSSANGYNLISDIPLVVTKNKNDGEFIVQGLPEEKKVQNKLKNFNLSLNKVAVDNLQKGIAGAEFSLYYRGNFVEKQVSDVNGKVDFNQNLIPGRNYTVKETAVPEGYLPITGVFTIQVKTSGQVIVDYAGTVLTNSQMSVGLTSGSGNNTIQYTVTNDPKRPLPRTGGMGIYVPITTGAIAMLVASFIYIYRKCRKGGVRQ